MKDLWNKYPSLFMWAVLATGMVAILLYEARNVGLNAGNWFWLIVSTILVAGLCVWIISWGDDEEYIDEETVKKELLDQ